MNWFIIYSNMALNFLVLFKDPMHCVIDETQTPLIVSKEILPFKYLEN